MKLSQALEQIRLRVQDGSLHKLLPDLVHALRDGAGDSALRLGASRIAAAFEHRKQSRADGEAKNVFNIAIAVAVGVPVSKQGDEDKDGKHPERAGRSDHSAVHGEGAPAVATASVSPQPDTSVPKAALAAQRDDEQVDARPRAREQKTEPSAHAVQPERPARAKPKPKRRKA